MKVPKKLLSATLALFFVCALFFSVTVPAYTQTSHRQEVAQTSPQNVRNRPFVGLSAFAAANENFPFRKWLRTMRGVDKPALSILWATFGDSNGEVSTRRVQRFTESNKDKPHLLEIHLLNQTCYDQSSEGRKCRRAEFVPNLNHRGFNRRVVALNSKGVRLRTVISARVKEIKTWVDTVRNENTTVILSTGLEDQYSDAAYNTIVRIIQEAGWTDEIVRNPETTKRIVISDGANYYESHPGSAANANKESGWPLVTNNCIVNLDGVSTPETTSGESITKDQAKDFIRRHQNCFAVLLWNQPSQGLDTLNVRPRRRTFVLSNPDIRAINEALKVLQTTEEPSA